MIMNDAVTPKTEKSIKTRQGGATMYAQTFHGKQKAQNDRQKGYYQSQFHRDNDYDKQGSDSPFHEDLTIHGAELHIDNYEGNDFASKSRLVNANGEAQTYNAKGGQQAKAIINTLK